MHRYPGLGIVGGAGHQVAAHLQCELLTAFQIQTRAHRDDHYPDIWMANKALPGIDVTGLSDSALATQAIAREIDDLMGLGAQRCLLACASLHAITWPYRYLVLNWLDVAAKMIRDNGAKRVAVLGSQSSRRDGVFDRALSGRGLVAAQAPFDLQDSVDYLIAQGMRGVFTPEDREHVTRIENVLAPHCDLIWWGCTELSLFPSDWLASPFLRSMDAMVVSALDFWLDEHRENSCI